MGEKLMKDDNAQMMILEAIFFGITVIIALAFVFQISPTSIQSGAQNSNELKTMGDNALDVISSQTLHIKSVSEDVYETNNPSSKLPVCIITNNYEELTDSINASLSDTILYNVYISNGSKTSFWCSKTGSKNDKITMVDPTAIAHYPISVDQIHLNGYSSSIYGLGNSESDIYDDFVNVNPPNPSYHGSSYEVILEMCYLLPS